MMRFLMLFLLAAVILLNVACATGGRQSVYTPPNAPEDRPVAATAETRNELYALMEPYIAQARATYPEAKARFLAGLPPRHTFLAVTRLRDAEGHTEQVFIAVDRIRDGKITGRIQNDIRLVQGFENGQVHTFPEGELVDWVISKPDGSEEGNFVGKFLDEYNQRRQ
jgi:hypothetical protein